MALASSLILLVFLVNINLSSCEVFTAISHLKALVDVEQQLTKYLSRYVEEEETRLRKILSIYDPFEQLFTLNFTNRNEVEKYVGNPIKSYKMLRRLSQFESVEKLIQVDSTRGINQILSSSFSPAVFAFFHPCICHFRTSCYHQVS